MSRVLDQSSVIEALQLSRTVLTHEELDIQERITELESKKVEMETISKLMHALSLGKRSGKEFKITDDKTKELIISVHLYDPKVFDDLVKKFPEGMLNQEINPGQSRLQMFFDAGNTLSEVEIAPIPADAIDFILRRLSDIQDIKGTEVSQLVNNIQQTYGDQEQFVSIMRDINDQYKSLLELMNSNMRG